jgi:preprotein translocase subunit SecA
MFQNFIRVLGGDPNKKEIDRMILKVDEINALEADFEKYSDEELKGKTAEFKQRLEEGETLDDLLPEAFAAVREASKRTIGLRHYDVQMIGGITLHSGRIAEMRTGEGKTLVATLPLYLNALTGKGTHLVTVNDYLARRDARWMAPVYMALGLSVGVLQMASRTENGRMAFIVDPEVVSPHEDQHQLRMVPRQEAYLSEMIYGTNSEFGFDYLRDNTSMRMEDRVQRGHHYAIVDEVDNILIDEARTPLIISGPAAESAVQYQRMAGVVKQLNPEDYEINEKDHAVSLTEGGLVHVEMILGESLGDPERPEDSTPEQESLLGYLEQSLRAQYLYKKNKEYLVQAGKVVIVDEFTGRLMPGRRWSDGLHQAVEAKEGVKVEPENVTYATITLQNYFRMYEKLSGMTGTALTEAEEFHKIYKLDVLPIPMNLEYNAMRENSPLIEAQDKDAKGYKFSYYAHRDDPNKVPVFWRRQDFPDVVYRTEEAKLRAISQEVLRFYVIGRPQLAGTTSVEHSERLSLRLKAEPVRRLLLTLLLRHVWLVKNDRLEDEREIPELLFLNKPIDELNTNEMRQLARQLELSFNPEDPENLAILLKLLELTPDKAERLSTVIMGGVPHQVLNARKHDEESKIIAQAGAFGAVTIATNMAGRGVDIKLGGELPDDALRDANRVLSKAGVDDPYNMTMEARREALRKMNPEDFGLYEEGVHVLLDYMDNMERVRDLGGLHVIGSERHEARRIDNQLRGRAARQGDPGSSRFYLSLQDELMRLFGGGQVEDLMGRLRLDESLPIESGIVARLVEQSQTRVEGSNFDIRKHLLEYDDVLNSQREKIYGQRNRAFTKDDLSEDIIEIFRDELSKRIPESLKDEEGPWRLLAYLESVQPAIYFDGKSYPTFTQRLLLDKIDLGGDETAMKASLIKIAEDAFDAEQGRLIESARNIIETQRAALENQITERTDGLENFISSLSDRDETDIRKPVELVDELGMAIGIPVRLTNDQMRMLGSDPEKLKEPLENQIVNLLTGLTITRLIMAFERRLEDTLPVKAADFQDKDWADVADELMYQVEELFKRNQVKLFGENGQIARDINTMLDRLNHPAVNEDLAIQLMEVMTRGVRMIFDKKTHKQAWQPTTRLHYIYLAASMLQGETSANVTADVLEHLNGGLDALREMWGRSEWNRIQQLGLLPGETFTKRFAVEVGEEESSRLCQLPLTEWPEENKDIARLVIGDQVMNEINRHLLLSVISELWVEYLTRVESLRVSIGLEAYAQRDPLVAYKSQASELFTNLLRDIRAGVIMRAFNYRPRQAVQTVEGDATQTPPQVTESVEQTVVASASKGRKRHRH